MTHTDPNSIQEDDIQPDIQPDTQPQTFDQWVANYQSVEDLLSPDNIRLENGWLWVLDRKVCDADESKIGMMISINSFVNQISNLECRITLLVAILTFANPSGSEEILTSLIETAAIAT